MEKLELFCAALWATVLVTAVGSTSSEAPIMTDAAEASDGELLSIDQSHCVEFKGAYARKNNLGIVCCGNKTLYLPIELTDNWETNPLLDHCTLESSHMNDADIPTAFWNITHCLFRNASVFADNKPTFDAYFNFVTRNYPDDVKKSIKTATDSCKAEAEKAETNTKKMQKFTECLHKSEKQVCHKPYETSLHEELNKKLDSRYTCPGLEGVYGLDRVDFCCKKESIPYNFLEFYVHFPKLPNHEVIDNCSMSFTNRQIELDPELKKELQSLETEDVDGNMTASEITYEDGLEKLEHCSIACDYMKTNYVNSKELKVQYEKVLDYMVSVFGTKIQNDLKQIVLGRKSVSVFHKGNSSMSFDEFMKKFDSGDELTRIRLHCNFYPNMLTEVDRALHEYCFDKEYADKWMNSHWKQITS